MQYQVMFQNKKINTKLIGPVAVATTMKVPITSANQKITYFEIKRDMI
jgi:hypothetical protein